MIYIVHLAMWCMGFYQNGIYTQNGDVRGKVMIIMNLFFLGALFSEKSNYTAWLYNGDSWGG